MADNKSCEGKLCVDEVFVMNDIGKQGYEGGTDFANAIDLTTKINVDVSDALKGLKAIQREAKKATASLRELEEQQKKRDISSPTDNEAETCPVCNGRIGTQELRADGELIKIVENVCTLCGWYNA